MKMIQRATALMMMTGLMLLVLMPLLSALAESGTNWNATYYNTNDLSGPVVYTEVLPSGIDVNWGTGSPSSAVNNDNFSARYTSVQAFNAGVYEFRISSDDGVRMFIDGVRVLDKYGPRILTTDTFQQTLTAGTHSLTVEYVEYTDQAAIRVQWFPLTLGGTPGITPGVTPGVPFLTPGTVLTPTAVYTGPAATVSGVRGLALRTGPYLGASFVTTLIGGDSYPVLARNRDEGTYNWYKLQVGDRIGWASGRYLTLNVDLNSLPLQGSIFDEIDGAADIGARAYPRAAMNLRIRPSTRMPEIADVPWGAPLELLGRTVQAGVDQWLHVRYNGIIGWIDASYVTVRGEIFQVPIR